MVIPYLTIPFHFSIQVSNIFSIFIVPPPPNLDHLGYKYKEDNYYVKEYGHLIHNAKYFFIRAVAKSVVMFISLYPCQPC